MIGYTVDTWFGLRWLGLPRLLPSSSRAGSPLAEAFLCQPPGAAHVLETKFPDLAKKDSGVSSRNGYLFLRPRTWSRSTATPAWSVKMAHRPA